MKFQSLLVPVVTALVMCVASAAAIALKPTARVIDPAAQKKLEALIPAQFGGWQIDPAVTPIQVAPDVQQKLDSIYTDILSRTYIDARGRRIMLSIAYGGEQSKSLQVHRPEVCYAAQGFSITQAVTTSIDLFRSQVPIKRLVAVMGARNEPITYWIRVGDDLVLSKMEQGLIRVRYGLTGVIPDGILVRVSSIGADNDRQYAAQDEFLRDLIANLSPDARAHLIGGHRS